MVDRTACERRVYRLATLLTGHPVAATRVISRVVAAQPDLRRLDSARLDRLTVLRSRDIPGGVLADDAVPREAAAALAGLTPQQREAWVLVRVYRTSAREVGRAMDCSVTAMRHHLAAADEAMGVSDGDDIAAALREYSLGLDVPEFYRVARRRRRRVRLVVRLALAIIAVGAVALIVRLFVP
jgi:hypothetical protein